jgi:diguanylate cyclase (GGDEF)-like protein
MERDTKTWLTVPKPAVPAAPRKAYLVQIHPTGPGLGSLVSVGDRSLVIGRADNCDVRLGELSVSRRHACIQPEPDGIYVLDLHSTNGTFLNGEAVERAALRDGDHLQVGSQIFRFINGSNVEANFLAEIYRLTIIDPLTGVHNKSYLLEVLTRELPRSHRYKRPLALILFDLDRFKAINDRLGHLAGDGALQELVRCLRPVIRKEALLARYGGEEFAMVLPEATHDGARRMAERLRQVVEKHPFHYETETFHVTVSVGVASTQGEEPLTPEELLRRADTKLYEAKSAGRNCVKA